MNQRPLRDSFRNRDGMSAARQEARESMKRLIVLTSILLLVCVSNATAYNFDITFTADNVINMWVLELGGSPYDITSALDPVARNDWQTPQTSTVNVLSSNPISLIWEVQNSGVGGSNNPAGFLAEIVGDVSFPQGSLLTSSDWLVSLDQIDWVTATEWGANNDESTIWQSVHGGPITGIAGEAEWIWWETNFSPNSPQSLYVRVDIADVIIPEPATMLLFGSGLIGLLALGRKKLLKN